MVLDAETATIPLTRGRVALVDRCLMHQILAEHSCWHSTSQGYAQAGNGTRRAGKIKLHRLVLKIVGLEAPDEIDHINGVKTDCRLCNLRPCSTSHNQANRRPKPNKTGYIGVRQEGEKFRAIVRCQGKYYRTRTFNTPIEAARARDELAKYHHGPYARLNFPDDAREATYKLPKAQQQAEARDRVLKIGPAIKTLKERGLPNKTIAAELNKGGWTWFNEPITAKIVSSVWGRYREVAA